MLGLIFGIQLFNRMFEMEKLEDFKYIKLTVLWVGFKYTCVLYGDTRILNFSLTVPKVLASSEF